MSYIAKFQLDSRWASVAREFSEEAVDRCAPTTNLHVKSLLKPKFRLRGSHP
jgi:hypothetical protein